ncbi:MAG: nucleotidyltransferase family protein [Thermaceae bacterium]
MPVRSLRSSVMRWPSREEVLRKAREWAEGLDLPGLLAVGVFGSYARGEAGVGSDLDLVVLVWESPLAFGRRSAVLPLETLPVPVEALVYTLQEWQALEEKSPRFFQTLEREAVWVWGNPPAGQGLEPRGG